MTEELQTLSTLVKMYLEELVPILSGNMAREIIIAELVEVNDHEVTFCINAPFYDMKLWRERGIILHSGQTVELKINKPPYKVKHTFKANYGNITDYAMWVNEKGAFGTHNASMHWVNRALNEAALMMPNAEVDNRLELS